MGITHLRSVQLLSHVQLFATPWTSAHQAFLSFTISQSFLKLMFIELVMTSNQMKLFPKSAGCYCLQLKITHKPMYHICGWHILLYFSTISKSINYTWKLRFCHWQKHFLSVIFLEVTGPFCPNIQVEWPYFCYSLKKKKIFNEKKQLVQFTPLRQLHNYILQ